MDTVELGFECIECIGSSISDTAGIRITSSIRGSTGDSYPVPVRSKWESQVDFMGLAVSTGEDCGAKGNKKERKR